MVTQLHICYFPLKFVHFCQDSTSRNLGFQTLLPQQSGVGVDREVALEACPALEEASIEHAVEVAGDPGAVLVGSRRDADDLRHPKAKDLGDV